MSKPVRYSGHALENLRARKIDKTEVEKTIASPERKEPGHPRSRVVYMRRCHDERLDKQVLLRVVIEETINERIVITAYKVTKIARYLKEGES